jgi:hypothetical protein
MNTRRCGWTAAKEDPTMLRRSIFAIILGLALTVGVTGAALATPSPNGPVQPGAPGTTCDFSGQPSATSQQPGNASAAGGSVFNPNGTAGAHYAGNPGTASAAHAESTHAVSQYDIACFQVTTH